MTQIVGNEIVTTGTGASDNVQLPAGDHTLIVTWAGSPGDLDLQVAGDDGQFVDALTDPADSSSTLNITTEFSAQVVGGMKYRANVTTHTSAATLTFNRKV